MSRTPEDRLVELETIVSHLQHDFEALNSVVLAHQAAIERLRRELERLTRQDAEPPSTPA